jgi:hypothetical protein
MKEMDKKIRYNFFFEITMVLAFIDKQGEKLYKDYSMA